MGDDGENKKRKLMSPKEIVRWYNEQADTMDEDGDKRGAEIMRDLRDKYIEICREANMLDRRNGFIITLVDMLWWVVIFSGIGCLVGLAMMVSSTDLVHPAMWTIRGMAFGLVLWTINTVIRRIMNRGE